MDCCHFVETNSTPPFTITFCCTLHTYSRLRCDLQRSITTKDVWGVFNCCKLSSRWYPAMSLTYCVDKISGKINWVLLLGVVCLYTISNGLQHHKLALHCLRCHEKIKRGRSCSTLPFNRWTNGYVVVCSDFWVTGRSKPSSQTS